MLLSRVVYSVQTTSTSSDCWSHDTLGISRHRGEDASGGAVPTRTDGIKTTEARGRGPLSSVLMAAGGAPLTKQTELRAEPWPSLVMTHIFEDPASAWAAALLIFFSRLRMYCSRLVCL